MSYNPLTSKIINLLAANNLWFETFEHEPVVTSEQASKVRTGYTINQGAKALIVRIRRRGGEKFFVMFVLPGSSKFSEDKVKKIFNASDIRFANPEELVSITSGVERGGVPPLGNLFGLKVYADNSLFKNEKIVFNAGDRSFSVGMKAEDYKNLVKPEIVEII